MKLNDSGQEKINQALLRKALQLEGLIVKNAPVYTGQYRNSWETELISDGHARISNPFGERGRALEFGGEAGSWPRVDELKTWVDRKINPGSDELDSVTYLVGRKIKREGIDPQPHIRPAIKEFKNKN